MVLKVSMYHNALKIIFIDLRTKVFAMKIFLRTVAKKCFSQNSLDDIDFGAF